MSPCASIRFTYLIWHYPSKPSKSKSIQPFKNIPAAAGEDVLFLRTGAEQLIVWQILNSTHLLFDIFPPRKHSPFVKQLLLEPLHI